MFIGPVQKGKQILYGLRNNINRCFLFRTFARYDSGLRLALWMLKRTLLRWQLWGMLRGMLWGILWRLLVASKQKQQFCYNCEGATAVATDAVSVAVTPYYTNGTGPITCCFCFVLIYKKYDLCQKPFISVFPYV